MNSIDDSGLPRRLNQSMTDCSGSEHEKCFCPIGGLRNDSSMQLSQEMQGLLHTRLRGASMVLFGGSLAFLIRNWNSLYAAIPHVRLVHLGFTVFLAVCLGLLSTRKRLGLTALRAFELSLFGVTAGFFTWMEFSRGGLCAASVDMPRTTAFISETCIPWISLIFMYGMFIPNPAYRAAAVLSVMGSAPILMLSIMGYNHSCVREILYEHGGFSAALLWITLPVVASIYGSHRIGLLRREAIEAKRLGAYRLIRLLGAGGMGEVYLAEHTLLKRPCAIKLILPGRAADPKALARFESEVQATARLTHWNTVEIYDYGHTSDGTFYYVMEYLPGMNLEDLIEEFGPMPADRVVYLLRQVCAALNEAHSMGLIHRDIKPGNIFAAQRGGVHDVAKLLDFGLVKSTSVVAADSAKLTLDGAVVGSPMYIAPESAMGEREPDARSDIYSLGATAYFLLTGRPVFNDEAPLRVIFAHVNEPVTPPSRFQDNIPPELELIVLRCLAKRPEDRYQSAEELETALATASRNSAWNAKSAARWWQNAVPTVRVDPAAETLNRLAPTVELEYA